MEIIQEQNLIFANYNKNKNNGLLSSYVKPTLDENNKYKRVAHSMNPSLKNSNNSLSTSPITTPPQEQQLSSSNPTSDYENDSSSDIESSSSKPHDNDEKEIGLVANILLKISSKEITIVSTSSSTSATSLVPNNDSPVLAPAKLADSTNCVPFGALNLDTEMGNTTATATTSTGGSSGSQGSSLASSTSSTPVLSASATGINPVVSTTTAPVVTTTTTTTTPTSLTSSSSSTPTSISVSASNSSLSLSASTDAADKKKKRQRTSPEQLAILEQIFETDKMPSQQIRHRLANQLGMSSRRVQIWFQNKRAKKQHKSRPTSPTQFNFTPVSFPSSPSSSSSSSPVIGSNIKLNSSSIGIPTSVSTASASSSASSPNSNFKQYNFSFDHHTTTANNSPPPPSSNEQYKEIRFHNVTLNLGIKKSRPECRSRCSAGVSISISRI
ncbi:homeobox transcription factor [Cavenderia fasciculata]|uniref:Homeobox transcription factor n=1 Tax=Cavenderia fasciculata TaxID=261658 RepID=F4QBW2_CACFS|nr:homeobox transcription factor [Cavenderia fasciculata]EGG14700.1 homeobox transcription factor [Cavenderia fasciculata]|eukprot:XP_004351208.1 homeobox transcription factor [Cavenderia fasciculata]